MVIEGGDYSLGKDSGHLCCGCLPESSTEQQPQALILARQLFWVALWKARQFSKAGFPVFSSGCKNHDRFKGLEGL